MFELNKIRHIHLLGVCGTAMASLAAMLKDRGYDVSGSDEGVYPPMSDFLARKQIRVLSGYQIANLEPEPDLAIIGNALSRGNPEVEYVLNFRVPYLSLPEAIRHFFLRDRLPVVVTGTHGKTTTTSMIAWVLHASGLQPDFLIGGIAQNFESSYGLEGGKHFVIEGDEYDSAFFDKGPKFLHYLPHTAIVGNVEFDHADIYADLDAIRLQFRRFVNLIPQRGYLAVGADSPVALEVTRNSYCTKETFGLDPGHDWSAQRSAMEGDRLGFDVLYRKKLFRRYRLPVFGAYNVRNALAATAVLHRLSVSEDDIRDGLESFAGVKRRLQLRAEVDGIRIFEDFAHHPTAVRETLEAVRATFKPKRLWALYEPRSATSRRNVFQHEIGAALGLADLVVMPDLFKPEKIPEGERLDLALLVSDLQNQGRLAWNMASVEDIIQKVCDEAHAGDLIVILSNGGFGGIYEKLPVALKTRIANS
jgi:UDP-N-acetylmuramate: L-alanyl-gamma-D-glutamyl-meso-diaminopimelate ligase